MDGMRNGGSVRWMECEVDGMTDGGSARWME